MNSNNFLNKMISIKHNYSFIIVLPNIKTMSGHLQVENPMKTLNHAFVDRINRDMTQLNMMSTDRICQSGAGLSPPLIGLYVIIIPTILLLIIIIH